MATIKEEKDDIGSAVSGEQTGNSLSTDADRDTLEAGLLGALTSIQTRGSFASFRKLTQTPPADLSVDGVGDILMPLNEAQASQLIQKARQAPFGKGSDTVVDTAVRNTWELDAAQFSFQNPGWPGFINSICGRVAMDLGINAPIKAEIYKMLIYEKGAMFKPHTDTEKIPGMFGTLVVCLPSEHQGGDVVLKHGRKKMVLKTSQASQSFACWYSDVSHEVLPVTTGIRWVLTYNLALDQTLPRPSAGLQRSETQPLRDVMNQWLTKIDKDQWYCTYHILDHDYTEANISLKALKLRDLAQVQTLQDIAREYGVEIFLAQLEKEQDGGCDYDWSSERYGRHGYTSSRSTRHFHPLNDIYEETYSVKTLLDLEGNVVSKGLPLYEDDLLQENCFGDIIAEEEYEGYMGNSGPTARHWYRVTAVVIVLREKLLTYFNGKPRRLLRYGHSNLTSQISYLARQSLRHNAPVSLYSALISQCQQAWASGLTASSDEHGMLDALKAAVTRRDYGFFEEAASRHAGLCPPEFFTWMRDWLATGEETPEVRFHGFKKGISYAVSAHSFFADQFDAISSFAPLPEEFSEFVPVFNPDYILDWARSMICSCLDASKTRTLCEDDGVGMVNAAKYFDEPIAFLSQNVAPKICQRRDSEAFFLAFLAELVQQSTDGTLPAETSWQLYRTQVRASLSLIDFKRMRSSPSTQSKANGAQEEPGPTPITHEELSSFFGDVIGTSTDADDLVTPLVSRLVADAPKLLAAEFHPLWLPFLHHLIPILVDNSVPLYTPYCQQIFSSTLNAYLERYVGYEPEDNKSLVRPAVSCGCEDCSRLNSFLRNPDSRVGRFPVNKQRRLHLHRALDGAKIDCIHETERIGSPQTLVITKTFSHSEKARSTWKARMAMAAEKIQEFEQDALLTLLGADYPTIVNMPHLYREKPARASAPVVAGVKRKLPAAETDVIDLTSD